MFIDSTVLIDYLRLYLPAIKFLDSLTNREGSVYISDISALELIKGTQNRNQLKKVEIFLDKFKSRPLNQKISTRARQIMKTYHLTHNIGVIDSLIAASALEYKQKLITINLKHFRMIKGLKIEKPY